MADSDGYIDSFPGTIVGEDNGTPLPVSVPLLKQALDNQWSALCGPSPPAAPTGNPAVPVEL